MVGSRQGTNIPPLSIRNDITPPPKLLLSAYSAVVYGEMKVLAQKPKILRYALNDRE